MARYRVLRGLHSEGGTGSRPLVTYGRGMPAGDVIETESDLLRLNSPSSVKFAKLDPSEPSEYQSQPQSFPVRESQTPAVDDLTQLSARELRKVAEGEGVELEQGSTKDQMAQTIRQAREG